MEKNGSKLTCCTNDFALDLLRCYQNDESVFISPFSISTSLSLVLLGSDGNTSEVIRKVLKYEEHSITCAKVHEEFQSILDKLKRNDDCYQLFSFIGALIQNDFTIHASYENALKQYYTAQIDKVDFKFQGNEAKTKINASVENATRGKIKDLLDEVPSVDTKLFLLSAVYFLGEWKEQFDPACTFESVFYNKGIEPQKVQMMHRKGHYNFGEMENLNASFVLLPYKGDKTASMLIVLPNPGTDISQVENQITHDTIQKALSSRNLQNIYLNVPKFSLEFSTDLVRPLTSLGLGELFTDSANLTRMTGDENDIQVTSAVHKAVIEVDERGCEAAAATGFACGITCIPPEVTVDRPFLFFVCEEESRMILFAGKVNKL